MKLPDEIIQKAVDRYARATTACDAMGDVAYSPRECIELTINEIADDIVKHAMGTGVKFKQS